MHNDSTQTPEHETDPIMRAIDSALAELKAVQAAIKTALAEARDAA